MKKLFGGVLDFVITGGVALLLAVWGINTVAAGSGERKLGEAPEVKVADLAKHDGKTVRVRAKLTAETPLRGADGKALAFQALVVTHEEESGTGQDRTREAVTDYARIAPQVLLAVDGGQAAGVMATDGVDLRFVPETAKGTMGSGAQLPAGAAGVLAASTFTEIPDQRGADVVVRSIPDGADVTVHGRVEVVDGTALLRAPADGVPFVVTPLPFDQVVESAASSGVWNLVLGWVMILGALALVGYRVRGWARGRRAPSAA